MTGLAIISGGLILVVIALQAAVVWRLQPNDPGSAPRHLARGATRGNQGALAAPGAAAVGDPLARIVDALRRRRWTRRLISLASLAAIGFAVWLIGYPFYTNVVQSRIQARLDGELASGELRRAYECTARQEQGCEGLQEGDSLTRLLIPKVNLDVVVVEGVGSGALRAGAGHYPNSAMPCEAGNSAIAGHRTTYGRPFHNLDLLRPGDTITLATPVGSCTYELRENPKIVAPDATWVLDPPTDASVQTLTLTTCHPKGSAKQRLIIVATLVDSETPSPGVADDQDAASP